MLATHFIRVIIYCFLVCFLVWASSLPKKKIKEFVEFVKYNYFTSEGVELDNEDFIRRWNEAYEVPNV